MNEKQNLRLKRNVGLDYVHTFLSNMNMQSSIWVLYLAYCGLHLAQIGLLEGIYHATSIVCEIPSGAAADLWGRKRCMVLSNLCIAVSCVIMLFSKSFGWFAVSFAVQALGNNLNSGSEEALVYDSMKCLGQEEHYMGVYGRLNGAGACNGRRRCAGRILLLLVLCGMCCDCGAGIAACTVDGGAAAVRQGS